MPSIRIAAAQSVCIPGDVAANVKIHTEFIAAAHRAQIDLLVFPELSLTGYELPLLQDRRLQPGDTVLAPLERAVRDTGMSVIVGAPLDRGPGVTPAIAAISFLPDGTTSVYCKQHLHPGEEAYVVATEAATRCHELLGQSFALAICADASHKHHAVRAAASGASLYLASVLVSEAGYAADSAHLRHHASELNLGVLMSNHGGPSGCYASAGKSAFWAPGGRLIVQAPGAGSVLAIASHRSGAWSGEVVAIEA